MFASLEMIGHLEEAESLRRAMGRADSLMNGPVDYDSKLRSHHVSYHFPAK